MYKYTIIGTAVLATASAIWNYRRKSYMHILPDDAVIAIASKLDLADIIIFSRVSKRYNRLLYDNDAFWRFKFMQDFPGCPPTGGNYRQHYLRYNSVWVLGENTHGQLAITHLPSITKPTKIDGMVARKVQTHTLHSYIIDVHNNLYIMGSNVKGQLGTNFYYGKHSIKYPHHIKSASVGMDYTMIIDENDQVYVFGSSLGGKIGLPENSTLINNPQLIPGIKAKMVIAGHRHSAIIDTNNNVLVCGSNSYGNLGLSTYSDTMVNQFTKIPNIKANLVICGAYHTVILDLQGRVYTFGYNYSGQLGLGHNITVSSPTVINNMRAKSVSTFSHHTAIIDYNNDLWLFGANGSGELGLGDRMNRNQPTKVVLKCADGVNDVKFREVGCGFEHTAAIDLDNNLYITGEFNGNNYNTFRQIPGVKARSLSCGVYSCMFIGDYDDPNE